MYTTHYDIEGKSELRYVLRDLNIEKILKIEDVTKLTVEEKVKWFDYIFENINIKKLYQDINLNNLDVEIDEDEIIENSSDRDLKDEMESRGYKVLDEDDTINFDDIGINKLKSLTYNDKDLLNDFCDIIYKNNYWVIKEKFKELL